jgi:YVTN family beta-propeller protein
VAVEPTGKFVYVTNHNSNSVSVFAIDPGTGALTAVGSPVATVTGPVSVTVDFLGRFAFVASDISNNVSVFAINGNTGALTAVGSPVASATGPASVTTTGKIQ